MMDVFVLLGSCLIWVCKVVVGERSLSRTRKVLA